MALSTWYWVIMFLWLVLGFVGYWPTPTQRATGWRSFTPFGSNLVLFLLFLIIGIKLFGGPVK